MSRELLKFFDVKYFLKFIFTLLILYYFNLFYIGLTVPGGLYNSFLAHNCNYIVWFRYSILYTSQLMAGAFGLDSQVAGLYTLQTAGSSVVLVYACLGLGVLSFWIAFVTAHNDHWKKKLVWSLAGMAAIWLINCLRIAILLFALERNWEVNKVMNHHDTFNMAAYLLIFVMIYLYTRKKDEAATSLA